jgi:hypothetical protein
MENVFSHAITRLATSYRIEISYDQSLITGEAAFFTIAISMRTGGTGSPWGSPMNVNLELQPDADRILISTERGAVGEFRFSLALTPGSSLQGEDIDILRDNALLEPCLAPGCVEALKFVDDDAFLACLARAATLSTVAQVIRCSRPFMEIRPMRRFAREIASCLGEHKSRLIVSLVQRSGYCLAVTQPNTLPG